VVHRHAEGVVPDVITTAEAAAGSVPAVIHARMPGRWVGRILRVQIEGWVDPELPARDAGAIGRLVAGEITRQRRRQGYALAARLPHAGQHASGRPGTGSTARLVVAVHTADELTPCTRGPV
jgi:hypothetical protein